MVVLIDKARRDFPNDLLNEFKSEIFRVPVLGPELKPTPAPNF
jgi:MoxR-like ATPase